MTHDPYYPDDVTGPPAEVKEPEERCQRCGRLPDDCTCGGRLYPSLDEGDW